MTTPLSSNSQSYKLPLKNATDTSGQTLAQLKANVDEYRAANRTFLSSIQFFFDCVNNKYASDTLINEREMKMYDSFIELFNFNHFNVRAELDQYVKKEAELSKAIDALTAVNAPRTESIVQKTAQAPAKADPEKALRQLQVRVIKLKKQRDHLRDSNKRMHQQYLDTLQRLEEQELNRTQGNLMNRSFEAQGHYLEKGRTHSVALRDSDNNSLVNLNNTFEIFPQGRTISVAAFNPEQLSDTRSVSIILDPPKRSNSILSNALSTESNNPDKDKARARKREIERQRSEIDMLNKEVAILKRELREERQEKNIIINSYERSVKMEKDSNYQIIQNLKSRLDANRAEGSQSMALASDSGMDNVSRADLEEMRTSQIEMASMLSSKIVEKNQTVNMLKKSLSSMLAEKRKLQTSLKDKSTEIDELQKKISGLENKQQAVAREVSELETTNSQLTTKFLMSVEREGEIMKKYNQMKMKLSAYEKLVEKLKGEPNAKH